MKSSDSRTRRSIVAGAAVLLVALGGAGRAGAANPATGTVSATSPTASWTAGRASHARKRW